MSDKKPKPKPKKPGKKPDVVARLQKMIAEKDDKIEKLEKKVSTMTNTNSRLAKQIDELKKKSTNKPSNNSTKSMKKKPSGGGVDSGPGMGGAAAMLAAKMGGTVKNKKIAAKGGVESGPSQKAAGAALGALFAKKKAPPSGGVENGPSQKAAGAALGALFAKKKSPPSGGGGSSSSKSKKSTGKGGKDYSAYAQVFRKYETMMKLGINVHGAVGRMRQDGMDKETIKVFERKHGAFKDDDSETIDWAKLGLKKKKEVPVGKGIKMKRLHWDPIHPKYLVRTIWAAMEDGKINYDKKHFELHFQVRQRKPQDPKTNSLSGQNAKRKDGDKISFVSKKRSQQVLIGMKNLNLSNDQLRDVLLNMDEKVMNVDTLSKLLDMVPSMDEQTEAEKKIMQEGTRRVSDYGEVEQFFFALYDFYNLEQRLKLWMFKQNFREICDSLQMQYKTIGKACDKCKNNKALTEILTIILAFGNHMNSGTRKGQIHGFNLKILTQMTGVKSFDNTRSLLMYIYEFCDRKYPKCLTVLEDLMDTMKSASSMEVDTLQKAYGRIGENMKEILNLVQSDEVENYDMDDRFIMVLTEFHQKMGPKMKKFNMTVGNVMVSTKRVMKKFSFGTEDEPKTIESFFKLFYQFLQDFQDSKEKLIKLEKERVRRIEKRKKAMQKKKVRSMRQSRQASHGAKDDQKQDDAPLLSKGSTLHREFQKKQRFEKKLDGLHGKLKGHVRERSRFVSTGGKLDGPTAKNETMRRLSSMYQQTQEDVKALEDARKKAAIMKYNKFRLPPMNPSKNKSNSSYNQYTSSPATTPVFSADFQAPDNVGFQAPKRNVGRNKQVPPARNNKPMPKQPSQPSPVAKPMPAKPTKPNLNNGNGHIARSPNGHNKQTLPQSPNKPEIKKHKHHKDKHKHKHKHKDKNKGGKQNGVPPPPGPPPNNPPANNNAAQYNGNQNGGGGAWGAVNANPQAAWQGQQAALGYGSNPNFSYQNYQAQQYNNAAAQPYYQQMAQAQNRNNVGGYQITPKNYYPHMNNPNPNAQNKQ